MPGLCGSLNHSLERSLRLVTPVSGLFMISPAAHTPCLLCGIFLIGGDVYTPTGRPQRWRQAAKAYDFDPRTSAGNSAKTPSNEKGGYRAKPVEAGCCFWEVNECRRCKFATCGNRLGTLKSCTA